MFQSSPNVILLHGLGRSAHSMRRMSNALIRHGFTPKAWDYKSRLYSLDQLIVQLKRYLHTQPPQTTHFVTHSLGGILLRAALTSEQYNFITGRIVMLAPPNQGARIVDQTRNIPGLSLAMGRPLPQLRPGSRFIQTLGIPRAEIGIIAGTQSLNAYNPVSWFNTIMGEKAISDGTVLLQETHLKGVSQHIALKASHSFIMNNPQVITQTIHFLQKGYFA